MRAIVAFSLRDLVRGRWALVTIAAFALAALTVSVLGLSSYRQVGLRSVGPAAVSFVNVALLLPSLQALLLGALTVSANRERGLLGMLRAAGASSFSLCAGTWAAVTLSTAISLGLGFGAAAAGLIVVSGMALGCDSAAHQGALDAKGDTIAVLGGGADVPSPASRARLYERILASGGLVLSEHPPGTRPYREAFPARNRIMAALAGVTVVVEAALRSGTRHTADHAQRLGRELAAVPGPVTSSLSALPNELIHDGAGVIRDVHDLLDVGIGVGCLEVRGTGPELDEQLTAALLAVEGGSATCDGVALAAGLDGSRAAVALARLELMGYVRGDTLGRYARTMLVPPSPAAESTPG